MSNLFEDRERSYEAKWAHDEEMHFRIMSMRNARLARWAAVLMHLPAEELARYGQSVVSIGMSPKASEAVFEKIRADLAARSIECRDLTIRRKMQEFYVETERQLARRPHEG